MSDAAFVRGIALMVVAVAQACSSDPAVPDDRGGKAELTVVHASPALGLIDVRVADQSVVNGLAYGRSSGPRLVHAGTRVITVRSADSMIAEVTTTLTAGEGTALTIGEDTTQLGTVIPDTGVAVSNRANLRLVNVVGPTSAAPTSLSVRLGFPDVSPDSIAVLGLDARVASHGPLMYFNPGHFRVWLVPQGSMTVLAQAEFDVAAGETALIVVGRNADGAYSVQIIRER